MRSSPSVENRFVSDRQELPPRVGHSNSVPKRSNRKNSSYSSVVRIQSVIELESRRIAQRLHDESSQMLAVVYLELAELDRSDGSDLSERLTRIRSHLDGIRKQMRDLSHEIRPLVLEQEGLVPALEQLASGAQDRYGFHVDLSLDHLERITWDKKILIYRAVQESLVNASRHASASNVLIRLRKNSSSVICTVSDDGIGMKARNGSPVTRDGLGLTGIRERVHALQGSFYVQFDPGQGCTVTVEVPV